MWLLSWVKLARNLFGNGCVNFLCFRFLTLLVCDLVCEHCFSSYPRYCVSPVTVLTVWSSSSYIHVMNHNWSVTKQHLHPQSVAKIAAIQFCQGTGFENVGHRLGLATRTQISVCKSPFPSAVTAVSLFRAKTVQQRPLLPRKVKTRLPDCGVAH